MGCGTSKPTKPAPIELPPGAHTPQDRALHWAAHWKTANQTSGSCTTAAPLPHSLAELNDTSTPSPNIRVDALHGHSNVTTPAPPPRIRRYSELIDPEELAMDAHVRSPSGNLLSTEAVLTREDRPLSIRERQAKIKERVQQGSGLGAEVEQEQERVPEVVGGGRKRGGSCCSQ